MIGRNSPAGMHSKSWLPILVNTTQKQKNYIFKEKQRNIAMEYC